MSGTQGYSGPAPAQPQPGDFELQNVPGVLRRIGNRAGNRARQSRKGTVAMKRLPAAVLGALLISAPAIALAGNGSGGGGMAGAVSWPVTAAISGPSTNHSAVVLAEAGRAPYTDAGGSTQAMTGTYQSQRHSNPVPNDNAMSLGNRAGGGG